MFLTSGVSLGKEKKKNGKSKPDFSGVKIDMKFWLRYVCYFAISGLLYSIDNISLNGTISKLPNLPFFHVVSGCEVIEP